MISCFFFFQAEDGIRDYKVTGVQTCALPISSESLKRWQPTLSTSVPGGVLGHLSMPSGTPSPSESRGQPFASTVAPGGVLGHWSIPSATPSTSESTGHPLASTWAPGGELPH